MIFSKLFMIIVGLSLPLTAFSEIKDDYLQAITLALNKIEKAEVILDKKFLECRKTQIANPQKVKDSLPNIRKEQLNNAIFYLSSIFHLRCMREEQADLVYKWVVAKQLLRRAKDENVNLDDNPMVKRISNYNIIISFPTIALAEVKYMKLPKNIRSKLESIKELKPPYDTKPLVKLFF